MWEMFKWFMVEVVSDYVPGSGQRKIRRLRKLQVATSEAIEKEINRLREMAEDGTDGRRAPTTPRSKSTARDEGVGAMPQPSSSMSRRNQRSNVEEQQDPILRPSTTFESMTASSSQSYQPRLRSPSPRGRLPMPRASPGSQSSGTEFVDSEQEIIRVCTDTCALMTCEHLKEGLRSEGLAVSGLKGDQAHRLGLRLAQLVALPTGPTVKQLRYVLWLWRAKDLAYKHVLRYHDIVDRTRISSLIHMLKMR